MGAGTGDGLSEISCVARSAKLAREGGEGGLTRACKEPGRSAKDPGHLLASLNCASAQAAEDGGGGGLVMQRHDFALDTTVGPGVFSTSKVILKGDAHRVCICSSQMVPR